MEIARWSQGDFMSVDDQINRFNDTLRFLSSQDKKTFEKVRSIFVEYCHLFKRGALTVDGKSLVLNFDANLLFTYDRCLKIHYPEQFKPLPDLTRFYSSKTSVLQAVGSN